MNVDLGVDTQSIVKRSLNIRLKLLGKDHPLTIESAQLLHRVEMDNKDIEEAEEREKQAKEDEELFKL